MEHTGKAKSATDSFAPAISPGNPMSVREEWRAYWPIVLVCLVGIPLPVLPFHTLGLFLTPLTQEFGWSRTLITAGGSLAAMLSVPISPFLGAAIDKWGARRFIVIGIILTGMSVASFGLANGNPAQWIALWLIYAIVALSLKLTVWTSTVVHAFHEGRSQALSVILCGQGIGTAIALPLAQFLIDGYGWRNAYFIMAACWSVPVWLLAFFFIRDIRHRQAAISVNHTQRSASMNAGVPGLSVREALRSLILWRIALATLFTLLMTSVLIVHKVPILELAGVSRKSAALLASLSGIAALAGILTTGWLMKRFHPGLIASLTNFIMAAALVPLLEPFRTPTTIVLSMLFVGFTSGTKIQVCSYLTAAYGGLKNYGKIYGVMSAIVAFTGAIGAVFGGIVFDLTGSYDGVILFGIPATIVSGLLLLGLGPVPKWDTDPAQKAGVD